MDASGKDRFGKLSKGDYAFGKSNRPSTPVKDIISGDYGSIAEAQIHEKYMN